MIRSQNVDHNRKGVWNFLLEQKCSQWYRVSLFVNRIHSFADCDVGDWLWNTKVFDHSLDVRTFVGSRLRAVPF